MKNKFSVVGVVVAVGIYLLWRFVLGPYVFMGAKNITGSGWDDAKPELSGKVRIALTEFFLPLDLKPPQIDAMVDCTTEKLVEFLNGTDCSYYYVESTTTMEEHLAEQDKCLNAANYDDTEALFVTQCAAQHIPNDWEIWDKQLTESYEEVLKVDVTDAAARKKMVQCMVVATKETLNASACKPLKEGAKKIEELLVTPDTCMTEEEGLEAKLEAASTACAPEAAPAQ